MMQLTEKEEQARKRVCLALDNIDAPGQAIDLADNLHGLIGMLKVGKELHTTSEYNPFDGRSIIDCLYVQGGGGIKIFGDLKFHDTPNTVYRASRAITVPGVGIFNLHVEGGEAMCRKAVEGAYEEAQKKGIERPKVIGVTVLTSLNDKDLVEQGLANSVDYYVQKRTELAKRWGLDGVVCPANKAGEMERRFGTDFMYVTPGIEWGGKKGEGQKQLYTPDMAVRDCSNSILVIGSAITKAQNKRETAYQILQAMAAQI